MTPAEAAKPTQSKIMDTTKSPTELAAVPGSFSALMHVQREVLAMQQKAHSQSETARRAGNSKDAAHYVTAAIVLNEVARADR